MKKGSLKQVLLMTDGCSNRGEDPVAVAALLFRQGVTVNVIGILDNHQKAKSKELNEVEDIAGAGGGISQVVYPTMLKQTVQTVTKQAMTQTIQGFINQELEQIMGDEASVEDLDPKKRGEVMKVVEDMEETCDLEILVLVDTSASMYEKLPTVKEALLDLSLSLDARSGHNKFSIFHFPGSDSYVQTILEWTKQMGSLSSVFPQLTTGGVTPTGPALREALNQFSKKNVLRRLYRDADMEEEA